MTIYASIEDLRQRAKARIPKPFYDYLENGSFTATTLKANRDDLDATKLRERLLNVSGERSTRIELLGRQRAMPVVLAPVGLSGMNYPRGEILAARAAKAFGVPYCLSTFSIAAIEDIANEVGSEFWFQLYPMRDDKINESLLKRAGAAGCETLVVTIDAQVEGTRYKDAHNGLGVPPKLTPGNLWAVATHPRWSLGMLRSPHFTFGNMIGETSSSGLNDIAEWVKGALRPALDLQFLKWVRSRWSGHMIVKGVLDVKDFELACDSGADGVVVSNHGGRQLEGSLSTARFLPTVADKKPAHVTLFVDSGVRTGIDVLRFLGLGANACFVGRAYNYGLGADGERGVTKALDILQDELLRTMALTGVSNLGELPPDLIEARP